MQHVRPDYKQWEQRATCCHCAAPLADNQLVKDAHTANNTAAWAKIQLRILSEMAEDRGLPQWYVDEANRIREGIQLL